MKRELRFFDILCIGINSIVGSGIFLFPGKLAGFLGPASPLAFLLCGILLIPIALSFASLGSRYETTGGTYLYARDAFGPWVGFAIGWMGFVMMVLSFAAVANAVAAYLGHFSPFFSTHFGTKLVACTVIVLLGALNYIGVRPAAWTIDFFTVAKLIPLFLFVIVGLFYVKGENFVPFAPLGFSGIGPAVFLCFFAFQGFENVPVPSGEASNPQRDTPLAVIGSLLLAGFLYVLIQFVAMGTYPGLAGSVKPLAEAGGTFLGPWGVGLIALGAAVSTIGYTTGMALVVPRYLYALARDGYLPAALTASHERFGTPHRAVMATTAAVAVAAFFLDFEKLVDLTNVTVGFQYVATCGAAWVLGRSNFGGRGWKLPLGPVIPLAGLAVVVYLSSQASVHELIASLVALVSGFVITGIYKFSARSN